MIKAQQHATVIVTSDTCFSDPSKDQSGQYVADELTKQGFIVTKKIVEDDRIAITDCVRASLIIPGNILIITVGGTGLCPRDVTPEATSVLYDKPCPGISVALHMSSLRYSPHAALSRLTAGISGTCLIINFPGKLKACKECFSCLNGFLSHALEQVNFDPDAIRSTHEEQASISGNTIGVDLKMSELISFSDFILESPKTTSPNDIAIEKEELTQIKQDPIEKTLQQNLEMISDLPTIKPMSNTAAYPLIEFQDALMLLDTLSLEIHFDVVDVSLSSLETAYELLGHTLKSDLHSRSLVPPFPVSTMDGYVVNIPSTMKNFITSIKTIQANLLKDLNEFEIAQKDPTTASNFFCYQINTGGRVPEDNLYGHGHSETFAVVPIEDTGTVTPKNTVPIFQIRIGHYVRDSGSDLNYTDCLQAGTVIGPAELSLILSMGHKSVKVVKNPTIGILSTGDELIKFGDGIESDLTKVIDTNGPLLNSFFKKNGYPVIDCGIAKDAPNDIALKIRDGLLKCNILVITGGASMGSKDHVRDVLEKMGCTIHFGRVNMKPGKPTGLASLIMNGRRKFIFTLPGNPVSAFITTIVLVMPFLKQGRAKYFASDPMFLNVLGLGEQVEVSLAKLIHTDSMQHLPSYLFDGRCEFLRAKSIATLNDKPEPVVVSMKQQSSRLMSLTRFDRLIMIPPGQKGKKLVLGNTYNALKIDCSN